MKTILRVCWMICALGGFSAFAASSSGVMLRPGGMYWMEHTNNGAASETKATTTDTSLILGMGFKMDTGFYIGGTYTWLQEERKNETGGVTVEEKDSLTAFGPTMGFVANNFYLLGTYHLSPSYVTGTDTAKSTYSGKMGYQIDIGYTFWMNGTFGFGPQFTYYYAEYKKLKDTAGVESDLPNTATSTELRPILAFAFMF